MRYRVYEKDGGWYVADNERFFKCGSKEKAIRLCESYNDAIERCNKPKRYNRYHCEKCKTVWDITPFPEHDEMPQSCRSDALVVSKLCPKCRGKGVECG